MITLWLAAGRCHFGEPYQRRVGTAKIETKPVEQLNQKRGAGPTGAGEEEVVANGSFWSRDDNSKHRADSLVRFRRDAGCSIYGTLLIMGANAGKQPMIDSTQDSQGWRSIGWCISLLIFPILIVLIWLVYGRELTPNSPPAPATKYVMVLPDTLSKIIWSLLVVHAICALIAAVRYRGSWLLALIVVGFLFSAYFAVLADMSVQAMWF